MNVVSPRPARSWALWMCLLVLVTAATREVRGELDQSHIAFIYLLVVLGGSASAGRALGLILGVSSFIIIDFFFQAPYDELAIGKPLDMLELVAFLATAVVATHLLARAQREARDARRYYEALGVERVRVAAEAERAEAERAANKMKDDLLASVSHDLRTPLTTIKALAQDAALRGDQNAGVIEEQADRLSRMVSDLLDLTRIKANALPIAAELNTADDLIGAALRQVAGMLQGRDVRTEIDMSQPVLVGSFDFVQSLRILTNLLVNAARHTPAGSPIDLGARYDGDMLVFEVADRGPGVEPADRQRIFEPFYRPTGSLPDGGGAGLGLAIARQLAEAQGGSVGYTARAGGGSIFALRLPAGAPLETAA